MATASETVRMTRNEEKWQAGIAEQRGSKIGLAVYSFAEAWALKMEERIAKGENLSDVAAECSNSAGLGSGLDDAMRECAAVVLMNTWAYGGGLRLWIEAQHGDDIVLADTFARRPHAAPDHSESC